MMIKHLGLFSLNESVDTRPIDESYITYDNQLFAVTVADELLELGTIDSKSKGVLIIE